MDLFPRRLEHSVIGLLGEFPAVVIVGARQVGKSTLARKVAGLRPSIGFDLERFEDRKRLSPDAGAILQQYTDRLVIIDEVQNLPNLFRQLRPAIDDAIAEGKGFGRFLLLGSATGKLLRQTGESLAGRVARVRLHGLDCLEVAADGDIDRLWSRGCYPKSYLAASDEASLRWRLTHLQHAVSHDAAALGLRMESDNLLKMLSLLAHRQGSTTNVTDMATDMRVARATVSRYLEVLEEMMLIRRLRPFAASIRKRVVKHPKYFICDSGLLHALCGVSPLGADSPIQPRLVGASWEGFALENIMSVLPWNWNASFYRDSNGNEVDLILERPGARPWAIEIKRSQSASLSKASKRALTDLRPERTFLVHGATGTRSLGSNIESIGLKDILQELWGQDFVGNIGEAQGRPIYTASECAELLAALKAGRPDVPLLRRELVKSSLRKAEAIVRECSGVSDSNLRLGWAQLRDDIVRWLDAESKIVPEDSSDSNFVKELRDLLEGLLEIKLGFEGRSNSTAYIASGWCAYDMFVNVISVLRLNEKPRIVHYLLSREYAGDRSSREFGSKTPGIEDDASDMLRKFILETAHSSADELIEAELIVMLFDIIASCQEKVPDVQHWPVLLEGKRLRPSFLRMARNREGRALLQACAGVTNDELAQLKGCMLAATDQPILSYLARDEIRKFLEQMCAMSDESRAG